jgi:hypothetical protein
MSEDTTVSTSSPTGPRIAWPTGPRRVSGLDICQAKPLGRERPSHLGVVIVAEDRARLLGHVASAIAAVPGAVIVGGFGHVISDRAFVNLLVGANGPEVVRAVAENVNALAGQPVEGHQYLIDRFQRVTVTGPNGPGFVHDVCEVLANHEINIRRFELTTWLEAPEDVVARAELVCEVELTRRAAAEFSACRSEICALSPVGAVTCE